MDKKTQEKEQKMSIDDIIKGCKRELNNDEKEIIEYINSLSKEQLDNIVEVLNAIEEQHPELKGKTKKYIDLLIGKI